MHAYVIVGALRENLLESRLLRVQTFVESFPTTVGRPMRGPLGIMTRAL